MPGHGPLSSLHWSSSGSSPGMIRMPSHCGATPVCPGSGMRSPAQRPACGSSLVAARAAVGAGTVVPCAVGEGLAVGAGWAVAFAVRGSGVEVDSGDCPGVDAGSGMGV